VKKIVVLMLLLCSPAWASQVCFDGATAGRLLGEIEECRVEIPRLQLLDASCDNIVSQANATAARAETRISELQGQVVSLQALQVDQKRNSEAAVKAATPSFWSKVKSASAYIGIGMALGFAASVGR